MGQAHAAVVAAACSGMHKPTLHNLAIQDAALSTTLAPACTQLTHFVLDSVVMEGAAAEKSSGQLATGLPALQELKLRQMYAPVLACHPQLLQRTTNISYRGWPQLLQQHAPHFQRLHTHDVWPHVSCSFQLLACPSLTQVAVGRVRPPSDGSVATGCSQRQ